MGFFNPPHPVGCFSRAISLNWAGRKNGPGRFGAVTAEMRKALSVQHFFFNGDSPWKKYVLFQVMVL